MAENWQKDYPLQPELSEASEAELAENSSLKKMLYLVGHNKRVIDFGCATGYLARLLNQNGCEVTGVEVNSKAAKVAEEYCERVIVADLDFTSVAHILPEQKFDVAVFGDVLEHLRDPWTVLKEVRQVLQPEGCVVASIPNIAHGAVRLALLQGKFEYEELGLLDNTHLRFFTRKTVKEMFEQAGYFVDVIDRTVVPVLAESNSSIPSINRECFSSEIIQQVEQSEDADTLQFVLRAMPLSPEGKLAAVSGKYSALLAQHRKSTAELQRVQAELQLTHSHTQNLEATLQQQQAEIAQQQAEIAAEQAVAEQLRSQVLQHQGEAEQLQSQLVTVKSRLSRSQFQFAQTQTRLEQVESDFESNQAQLEESQTKIRRLRGRLQNNRTKLELSQQKIVAIQSSKFWKLRRAWFKLKRAFGLARGEEFAEAMPVVTLQKQQEQQEQQNLSIVYDQPLAIDSYEIWLNQHRLKRIDLKRFAETLEVFPYKPIITIIMPVYNPPERFLREAIDSVLAQVYPHWELCIADDSSPEFYVQHILEECSTKEPRIKVVARQERGQISRCLNSALGVATGEFVALLNHDDLLTPDALYEAVLLLNKHPEVDMLYSDEDRVDEHSKRQQPFFKPNWCPDSFLSRMYTSHLGVYRRAIVDKIGGFRVGFEGGQNYDLVLRFTEKTNRIAHISKILYHSRIHPESVANGSQAKPDAEQAAQRAIAEALDRRGERGQVLTVESCPETYIVRYQISQFKLVSIIIPTRNLGQILDRCLESIFAKSTYPNYEVVLIDNGSTEAEAAQIIAKWLDKEPDRFKCCPYDIPFNYSKINNYAVEQAKGEFLLFLNNDTEVITSDWIEAMIEQAQRSSIGAVGVLLLYPDNTIQHAGVVMGLCGVADHSHKFQSAQMPGYFCQVASVNNYSSVTGACLMCKREVFEQVGGFNENLAVAYNDVDLCLKMIEAGFRNIYLPHVVLYHYESKSRGCEDTPEKLARFNQEIAYMREIWTSVIESDPYYNSNLSVAQYDYSVKKIEDLTDPNLDKTLSEIKEVQEKLNQSQTNLRKAQKKLEQSRVDIAAMETSKFWKLRTRWIKLKSLLKLGHQE